VTPRTHYLNSDFDIGLRPRPRRLERSALERQVRELSAQALLGAEEGSSVLVRVELPEAFPRYLAESGLPTPRILVHPAFDASCTLDPFGWSGEAIELNRRSAAPARHPPLELIRRVNSRSFALELQAELGVEDPGSVLVESAAELESLLARSAAAAWVLKAEHGNAGLANRRLGPDGLGPADRRFVERCFAEDDRLLVERWLPRGRDWCVVFDVPFDARTLRMHETVCTRDGALIGALFDPLGNDAVPWAAELGVGAERIAARLEQLGYFGSACFDAFDWLDGDRRRLRSLVDLNGRRSMSAAAYRCWQGVAPDRFVYYRFFNWRKLDLPDELPRALDALGRHRFDRSQRRGILLAAPLTVGDAGRWWRPTKLAVLFVADDRPGAFALERAFRDRLER